jgi:hypothetical protein
MIERNELPLFTNGIQNRDMSVVETIVELISPHVGRHMARAAVEAHAKHLGLDPQDLSPPGLEALAARIGLGLELFVGKEKSTKIQQEILNIPLKP